MAHIVFIEDEPMLQKTLSDFLRQHGHTTAAAFDGESGLALIRREKPALVVLDLILPRLHGLEVLERMQHDDTLRDIPAIVLTNLDSSESVERAIELGVKAYLVKTDYTLDGILQKIEAVLGEGR